MDARKPLLGLILIICLSHLTWGQKIKIKHQALLPKELNESSGLLIGKDERCWTINDSGNLPVLYNIDKNAQIKRRISIKNAQNIDWEDLANDYNGFAYIADIGNNKNKRKDLIIYKIPHPDKIKGNFVEAQKIEFYYENQQDFPPPKSRNIFDAEALIAYPDSLFIFTKNRTEPYTQYTYVYAIPNKAGHFKAVLRDSIRLKCTKLYFSWVTAAERFPKKDELILLSHKKAWIIKNFRKRKNIEVKKIKIGGICSQKEAVAIDSLNRFWISNEKFKNLRAKLKIGKMK